MTHAGSRSELLLDQAGAPAVAQEHAAKRLGRVRRVHDLPRHTRAQSINVSLCRFNIRNDARAVDLPVPYNSAGPSVNGHFGQDTSSPPVSCAYGVDATPVAGEAESLAVPKSAMAAWSTAPRASKAARWAEFTPVSPVMSSRS